MVNIALLGCGKIGQRHLEVYSSIDNCKVFLYDTDNDLAERQAARFGCARFESLSKVFRAGFIDAVDICTPTYSHAELAIMALDAHKHVFCEKPLCLNSEEAQRIYVSKMRTDREVFVGYLYRYAPVYQFVKATLDSEIIGAPYFAILRIGGRGSHVAWKHSKEMGGGAIYEMLVHLLDLSKWLFGELTMARTCWNSVLLRERHIDSNIVHANVEDCVVAMANAGNVQVLYEADLLTPAYMNYTEIQGENGSIFASLVSDLPAIVYCREKRGTFLEGRNVFAFPTTDFLDQELNSFLKLIRGERVETFHSITDSLELAHILEKLQFGACMGEAHDK